jgi:hypothetical protein
MGLSILKYAEMREILRKDSYRVACSMSISFKLRFPRSQALGR